MKKTFKIMLAALISVSMLLSFAAAAEYDAPATDVVAAEDTADAPVADAPATNDVATDDAATDGAVVTESVYDVHAQEKTLGDRFSDAPAEDHWSYQGLNCAVENEVMNGHNGEIRPSDNLTRAEMVTMMVRLLGAYGIKTDISAFVDVPAGSWYYESIQSGHAINLINGDGNKMMPTNPITREQTMAILARTFLFSEKNAYAAANFADASSISAWAKGYVNALVEAGVVLGNAKNEISPRANITRAEFATMLDRIVCYLLKGDVNYSGATINGSVILTDPSIDLSGATINGDLYIVEKVGDAEINLSGVTVNGRVVIRSGNVTIADDTKADEIVRIDEYVAPETKPEVKPDDKDDDKDDGDKTVNASTPGSAEKLQLNEDGTYISYGDNGEKLYADITGRVITFDLSDLDLDVDLHDLYIDATKKVSVTSDGFGEVLFSTREETALADLLADMINSTSKSVTKLLGITDENGNVNGEYKLGNLADMIESAYIFYTNDESAEKWLQALFNNRGIDCNDAANKASFVCTIGGTDYTIAMVVPE